jgi:uncharacterized membrane protein YwaF
MAILGILVNVVIMVIAAIMVIMVNMFIQTNIAHLSQDQKNVF